MDSLGDRFATGAMLTDGVGLYEVIEVAVIHSGRVVVLCDCRTEGQRRVLVSTVRLAPWRLVRRAPEPPDRIPTAILED